MTQVTKTNDKTPLIQKDDDITPLREKTPKLNYTKRYDQVSWRSADTDFEVDPSASSADELGKITFASNKVLSSRCPAFCTRRNRKLIALASVVVIFLIIMSGLIYLYYVKRDDQTYVATSEVLTTCGKVTGIVKTLTIKGKEVESYVFKGIPYAKPPVGPLRWTKPSALDEKPSSCWSGVFEASSFGSECLQKKFNGSIVGSEDCLFLNVFTSSLSESTNLPVFVWIHGGNLMTGNSYEFGNSPDSEFSHSMGVVSVSMNYRLNVFGFLSLKELWKNNESYGNYGFMDQILALQWVHENIKNFGGNPSDITLCGQGSGGTSLFALLVSPLANGLFHRVISMSGSARYEESYMNAAEQNQLFLNNSGCNNLNLSNISSCLNNLTAAKLLDSIPNSWFQSDKFDFPTKGHEAAALAVVDPIVVPRPPHNLKDVSFSVKNKIPIITGSTAQEIGIRPVYNFSYPGSSLDDYKSYLKDRLIKFSPAFLDEIFNLYVNITSNQSVEYLHETIASDVRLNCPLTSLLNSLLESQHHLLYRYIIESAPSKSSQINEKYAFRGWDSHALFDFKSIRSNGVEPTKHDLKFRNVIRENFQHFITFGHMKYTEWVASKTAVIDRNNNIKVLKEEYHNEQCVFWNNPANGFRSYAWKN